MSLPDAQRLYGAINTTWPARQISVVDGWEIRDGAGGGKRASAATLAGTDLPDISVAETEMAKLGQQKLFMVRDAELALDAALSDRGYKIIDPVTLYVCRNDLLTQSPLPFAQSYSIWGPVQVMREIWHEGGISDQRIALMDRVVGAKTGLLARTGDTPAGTGFIAMDGDIAMVHAVEVLKAHRGQGVARKIMAQAAYWAQAQGAKYMSLMTTTDNAAANGLYQKLGMTTVGAYHYRIKESL